MRDFRAFLLVALTLAASSALLAPRPAAAQGFGENKVQYESLDWRVLETPHLRVHYYAQEESLARSLTAFAESVAVEYDARFRVVPKSRIPLLLYSTHHLFQQTNATPDLLTESVGGLTELIKGRVLIPHNGSWARLRWVTRHELTHAYQLVKFQRVFHEHHKIANWFPDLWFTEGLAEFCGTSWDADAEGLLRDMVTSNMAYPLMHSEPITGSVEMYKEGQSFLLWLADRYGAEKVFDLLDNAWRADDFETCFKLTYGRPLRDVDAEWFEAMHKRYYPSVGTTTRPREVARGFAQHSRFNLGPRALPAAADSDTTVRFCFFEVADGATDLVVNEPAPGGGRRERRLLRGGNTPAFESFHLFQNRPGVSRSGLVALTSKRGGRDALYLVDSRSGSVRRRLEFPELVALHDPSVVPGDRAVVFTAQDYDGQSDLYRADFSGPSVTLERLTHDDYDDVDPAVSPDGAWVAFASDRCDAGGRYALFRLALAGGSPEQVSFPERGDDRQPVWSPDGRWLAFRSTRGGTSDLYVRAAAPSHEARRVTRMTGPVSDPDWTFDGRRLLFTAEDQVTFRTYAIDVRPDSLAAEPEGDPARVATLPVVSHEAPSQAYQRRLGIDLIQNSFGTSPSFNSTLSFGQVALSDVLGNEQYIVTLANDSEQFGDFWGGWEGGLTYLNMSHRLNYGLGLFRLTSIYDPDFQLNRREPRVGMVGLASYPFSRYDRIEGSIEVRHATHHLLRNGGAPTVDLVANGLGYSHDNSRWTYDGPVGGTRLGVNAGFTRDMTSGQADFGTLFGELRHYRQPLPRLVWASRASAWASYGRDAQRFYLGGPVRLHLSEYRALAGLQIVNVQQELRYPLVRGLTLGFPIPGFRLPTIYAAAFADGGWAYDHEDRTKRGVVGWSLYLGGAFFPAIRWNFAWSTTDFKHFDNRVPHHLFTLGYNF